MRPWLLPLQPTHLVPCKSLRSPKGHAAEDLPLPVPISTLWEWGAVMVKEVTKMTIFGKHSSFSFRAEHPGVSFGTSTRRRLFRNIVSIASTFTLASQGDDAPPCVPRFLNEPDTKLKLDHPLSVGEPASEPWTVLAIGQD